MRTPAGRDPEVWPEGVAGRLALASVRACETHRWTILQAPSEPGAESGPRAIPFACKSWRCRRCGWWVARDDMKRLTTAATSRDWWIYLVLTFDPADFDCGWDAYRDAEDRWRILKQSMRRAFGPVEYVQTWERHVRANVTPHVNVLLRAPRLRAAVEAGGVVLRQDDRAGHGHGRVCALPRGWRRDWLQGHAQSAGFGLRVWAEVVGDSAGMAWYLAKAAHDLGASRFKRGDQTPIGAPPHFRRLRASRGLMPPRPKPSGLWTGTLARERIDGDVTWDEYVAAVEAAEAARAWASTHKKPPQYERGPCTPITPEVLRDHKP